MEMPVKLIASTLVWLLESASGVFHMMLRKVSPMFIATLVICSCAAYADSIPMPGAVAQVSTTVNPFSWNLVLGISGSSSGTESSASIDMTTGKLRVATSGSDLPYAGAEGFEFLQFSGNGTISYNFAVSGTLSNSNPTGAVIIGSSAIFY